VSRRVVINQSNYLPWKGYFDLIHDADVFIFLDDVQYTKNDWRNRNRIKGPNGLQWLTIPIGGMNDRTIEAVPLPDGNWRIKHWRSLQQVYGRTSHFGRYEACLKSVYEGPRRWSRLSEMNQWLIETIARDFLGLTTRFTRASDYGVDGGGEERVLGLVKAAGGTRYVSGPAGQSYLNPARFAAAGLEIEWKDYQGYPEYPQLYPPFEHAVSVLDLLFSVGPDAPAHIWGWRAPANDSATSK
jgi:hypothetical protein